MSASRCTSMRLCVVTSQAVLFFHRSVALGPDQLLLRGAMLRNTRWIFGVVIYTGHDTKLMQNNTATAPLKRSTLDRLINTQILMLFFILLILCILSAIFNAIWTNANKDSLWYLGLQGKHIRACSRRAQFRGTLIFYLLRCRGTS